MIVLPDQAAIEALPDGTTITWERIPGDATSRAIAFVHRGVDPDSEMDADGYRDMVTWISPGGWDPKSPEDAGINYPVHVVVYGDLTEWLFDGGAPTAQSFMPDPPPLEFGTLLSGGTYPRDEALRNAVALVAREYRREDDVEAAVLPIADVFAAWLAGDQ